MIHIQNPILECAFSNQSQPCHQSNSPKSRLYTGNDNLLENCFKINTSIGKAESRICQKVKLNCNTITTKSQPIPWGTLELRWLFRVVLLRGKGWGLYVYHQCYCKRYQLGQSGWNFLPNNTPSSLRNEYLLLSLRTDLCSTLHYLFHCRHFGTCAVVSHYDFNLYFSNQKWIWALFQIFISHLDILLFF